MRRLSPASGGSTAPVVTGVLSVRPNSPGYRVRKPDYAVSGWWDLLRAYFARPARSRITPPSARSALRYGRAGGCWSRSAEANRGAQATLLLPQLLGSRFSSWRSSSRRRGVVALGERNGRARRACRSHRSIFSRMSSRVFISLQTLLVAGYSQKTPQLTLRYEKQLERTSNAAAADMRRPGPRDGCLPAPTRDSAKPIPASRLVYPSRMSQKRVGALIT